MELGGLEGGSLFQQCDPFGGGSEGDGVAGQAGAAGQLAGVQRHGDDVAGGDLDLDAAADQAGVQ
jgi:hypothetical protein